mmetsp:Transcript_13983/g.28887  ORF Transcript_13983/g.28887 Transcript_13983/m.28887 type:complete len:303 (+) Transcript_13983:240-1148(+)
MHVPFSSHLEFLHLCKDLLAFLFFFIEWSRRARKVVASERSRINSNGLLGVHVPFGSGLQLLHLFQDTIAFLKINFFVVFVLFSRRTGKKVSSVGSRIDSHGLLWAHVPLGGSLELLHLFQDALTFLLVLLLGSRRTSKVVASKSRGIRGCNGLFGRQIPLGNFLEVLGIGQDLFALLFVIGNGSRVTRKEATGLSTHRTGYGSFGMIVILGNLAKLAGFLQDLATFGQVFIRFFLVRRVVGLGAHDRGIIINRFFLDGDGDRVGLIHGFRFRSILSTSCILLHVRNVERGISDLRCTRNGL